MTRIWIVKDLRPRRDHWGKLIRRAVLGVERAGLCLAGQVLTYGEKRETVTPSVATVISAFMLRRGSRISLDDLASALWPEFGTEPNAFVDCCRVYASQAKTVLRRVGVNVEMTPNFGYELILKEEKRI